MQAQAMERFTPLEREQQTAGTGRGAMRGGIQGRSYDVVTEDDTRTKSVSNAGIQKALRRLPATYTTLDTINA